MHGIATTNAWVTPFVGDVHHVLAKDINEMNAARSGESYRNFLPIIQSSGMGKSRTVDQLATEIFTLPFNLRSIYDLSGALGERRC